MKLFFVAVERFLREEDGAQGVEYALLAGLIAIAFVVGATALGTQLNTFFTNVSLCIASPSVATCSVPFAPAP
ncbi:MAG TPA: Flp family type IVb pilin [Burkholderiales bacterium]|nr:Flp family type IVb pilin [Burkholderiales bacterium]